MLPFQLNSSSTSNSSAQSGTGLSTSVLCTTNSTLVPTPDLLNLGASESVPSGSLIQLDLLPGAGFEALLGQPHLVQWLSQMPLSSLTMTMPTGAGSSSSLSSSSGSASNGCLTGKTRKFESTAGHQSDESDLTPDPKRLRSTSRSQAQPSRGESAKPAGPAQVPIKEATQTLLNSDLFKTRQQLRDDEFERVIKPFFPTVLIKMTHEYIGSELSLSPLDVDEYNVPVSSSAQHAVQNHILEDYSATYPGSVLFQNEIAQAHHRTTLDALFSGAGNAENHTVKLKAIASNNASALKQRRNELASLVNYLSYSQCEQLLQTELSKPGKTGPLSKESDQQRSLNNDLLIEAMQRKRHGPETEIVRRQTLEFMKAKSTLKQANDQLKVNRRQAYPLFLKALQLLCRLHKKREVIELVIRLIEQTGKTLSPFDGIAHLFGITRALCLRYPFDHDLYARLVYAMDEPCRVDSKFERSRQIYDDACRVPLRLRQANKATFLLRHIQADFRSGDSYPVAINKIHSAVEYCIKVQKDGYIDSPANNMSRAGFVHSFALLCQLGGKIIEGYHQYYDRWSETSRSEFLLTVRADHDFYGVLHGCQSLYFSLLPQTGPRDPTPRLQLLAGSAHFYLFALVLLLEDVLSSEDRENQRLLVSLFGELVDFYKKNLDLTGLEVLLNKKNLKYFMNVPDFRSSLPDWRRAYRELTTRSS